MKRLLLIVAGLAALTGCSSFHKEWSAALKKPIRTDSIEGPWSGDWRSAQNGHHGSLRCVVTKKPDATYRAHYRATYGKMLHFSYVATLTGSETNGGVALKGEANLGKLAGGIYQYEGLATPAEFQSTYSCKYDHGRYQMSRPPR